MKQKTDFVKQLTQKAVEHMIDRERAEWPPSCPAVLYQPRRPECAPKPQLHQSSEK